MTDYYTNLYKEFHTAERAIDMALECEGITGTQRLILDAAREKQTATSLANAVGISPSGLTRMVGKLEKRGLIERHRTPEDRRLVYVKTTSEGKAKLKSSNREYTRTVNALAKAAGA